MKYETLPFIGKRLPRKNFHLIWFSFLTSLTFIEVYVLAIVTCVICFTGKIWRVNTNVRGGEWSFQKDASRKVFVKFLGSRSQNVCADARVSESQIFAR